MPTYHSTAVPARATEDFDFATDSLVSPEAVRRIAAMDDRPVLRNLLITQSYHHLANRLGAVLGFGDANWCCFATWASRTAGTFIRGEELRRELERFLDAKSQLVDRLLELDGALAAIDGSAALYGLGEIDPLEEVIGAISRYVGEGNRIVFAELGELFARFLAAFERDPRHDPGKLEELLGRLRPGPSAPDVVEHDVERDRLVTRPRGGQDLLRKAFTLFYDARFETEPKHKAELILHANALAGLHEQIRLDPYIRGALDAPVGEILFHRNHDALAQRLARELLGRAQAVLDRFFRPVAEELSELAREASTRLMMEMEAPGETVKLGEDLPAPPGRPLFPAALARLEDRELGQLLREYGAGGAPGVPLDRSWRLPPIVQWLLIVLRLDRPRAVGSAARDWSDLAQRMRFIFSYFRSRQQENRLFEAPFTAEETRAILRGEEEAHGEEPAPPVEIAGSPLLEAR